MRQNPSETSKIMDVWIIENGEKTGPLHDFEIRRKIEASELVSTTLAWHEGLESWKPLAEIALFSREFDLLKERNEKRSEPSETPRRATQSSDPHLVRRFWARWFDLYLFAGFWWLVMWITGRDIGATHANPWILLFLYVPWFVIETILLHRFGTTPGKWLLGIRIVNDDGRLLSLRAATRRSARVMFLGVGFGMGILSIICQVLALVITRRQGRPLWDHLGGHRLQAEPLLNPWRIMVFVIGLSLSLHVQTIIVAPYAVENMRKMYPELSEKLEKNLPKE